ncbi:diguanylate cyclase domain-containing protein [Shewanella indica]|uniref:transporter substrate-binding domain-containing diguanylate cyclase n=1 Tax=Shewanella indica TaxID=768528 RepID=UPI003999FE65
MKGYSGLMKLAVIVSLTPWLQLLSITLSRLCQSQTRLVFLPLLLVVGQSLAAEQTNKGQIEVPIRELVVTNSGSWKPFSYLNDAGEPSGMLVDIWREYAKANRVKIRFILTDWQHSLDLVRSGQADIHAGLLWSQEREHYLDYAQGLLGIESQLFFNQALLGTEPGRYLDSGGEVGVVSGGYEEAFVRREFPNTSLIVYASNEQMLKSAVAGRLKAFVADLQVANFYLYTSQEPTLFVPVRHLYSAQIRSAVKEGNITLQEEIRQGLARIPDAEYQRILNRWMYVETVYPRYLLQVVLALLFLAVISYVFMLRRTVAIRTAELEAVNAELLHLAATDSLTGISNRRAFMEALEQACDSRSYDSLTLLLFDIDDFKRINDSYGHLVGDELICQLVQRVATLLPEDAVFARVGGEEFCILQLGMTESGTQKLARSLLLSVGQAPFSTKVGELPLSISIGAVYADPGSRDPLSVLADADRLMYQVKASGRNDLLFRRF